MISVEMRRHAWLLALLLVVAAGVRFHALDSEPLWLDEAVSVHYAERALFDIPAGDPHPHLYYGLLHFWLSLGDQEAAVRSLSAILGVVTVGLAWALARELGGAGLAWLTATLVTVSPFLVRYSQEARMYSLLAALATAAMWGLARVARVPSSKAGWPMFILGTALMLHTHNIALGFLLLANLFLAMVLLPNRNPGGSRRWLLSQVFIVLLWAPALPRLLRPATRAHLAIPDLTWGHLMGTVRELYLPGLGPASAALVLLLLVALAFSALRARTDDPRLRRFAVVFALLPLPLIALVSLAWPLLLPRVLIWTVVPWLVLVGRGALQLQSGFARLGAVALLSGLSLFGLQDYFGHPQKEAWDKAAAHVAQRAETRDLVVFVAGYVDVPFNYYFRRQPVALDQFSGTPGPVGPGHLREIERAVEDRPRVWLVRSHAATVDPTDSVLATLRRTHPRHDRTAFEGVEVYLMRTHL